MVYSVQNNTAYINGNNGIYDNKIADNSVRYGRNAASNHFSYLDALKGKPSENSASSDLSKNSTNLLNQHKTEANAEKVINESDEYISSMPPLDFEYRYMPEGANSKNIDKMALLGSAFEEMGKKISMPVQELTDKLKLAFKETDARVLDINRDGQIDTAEYSTSILASDMLSKNPEQLDAQNITGVVNKTGLNTVMAYANEKNQAIANKSLTDIYNAYNLGEAQNAFSSNPANTLDIQA